MTPDRFIAAAFREVCEDSHSFTYRLVMQRAAELARESVGDGWLPIESAPKRTKVLVAYRNSMGLWRRVIAKYYGENQLQTDPDYSDEEFAAPGWYECVENSENISQTDEPPELWQPLSEPPTKDAAWNTRAAGDKP